MTCMSSDKHHLKIELDDKEYQMFLEIKEHYNIKNKTDVLRLAIKEAYRIIMKRNEYFSIGKEKNPE